MRHQGCKSGVAVQRVKIRVHFKILRAAASHAMLNAFNQKFECDLALAHESLKASHVVDRSDGPRIIRTEEPKFDSQRFTQ